MKASDLYNLADECRNAKTLGELREIVEALIDHAYFRQQEHEAAMSRGTAPTRSPP